MTLDLSQIRSITCGAEHIEQRPEGIWFQRMTDEQLEVYREPNPGFYAKALTTSGVMAAGGIAEISRRTADIVDISLEVGHFGYLFCLGKHAFGTARANGSSLVEGERAEIAGAEAASVVRY